MLRKIVSCTILAVAGLCGSALASTGPQCSNITLGDMGSLNGFIPSPNDAWHLDVTTSPVDPNSATILSSPADLGNSHLHPDFSNIVDGAYGIPYTVVDSGITASIAVPILIYPADSDITLFPVPATIPVEGTPGECPTDGGDRHAIIIDRNKCVAYELFQAAHCSGGWSASGAALWDFTVTEKRPYGMSSADAAGLSIFEGLVRYDEIIAGSINHALRFTAAHTKSNPNGGFFTFPATHAAGNSATTDNIIGMRIRLRADFDISGFSPTNQIILKAMKQYGMILADNGSNMFFQGTPDSRWNDDDLSNLKAVPSSAFDVVQMGPVTDSVTAATTAAAAQASYSPTASARISGSDTAAAQDTTAVAPPTISTFTASPSEVASGAPVTLTSTTDGSYSFVDGGGLTRGSITVNPTETTTYTVTSRNIYGTSTETANVIVRASAGTTLTFNPVADVPVTAPPFTVSASSNSPGAITYSVVSGPAFLSGNTVTPTGIGVVTLQATQAAAGSYAAATTTTTFKTNSTTPTLAFIPIADPPVGSAPFQIFTTSDSLGAVTFSILLGPATVSGNVVTVYGAGSVILQADQAAAGGYVTGQSITTFTVGGTNTGFAFVQVPVQSFGGPSFTVTAVSGSPGPITYSVVSGPATISGNVVTATATGTVTLQANQAAYGAYPAGSTQAIVTIIPGNPGLSFPSIPDQPQTGPPFTIPINTLSNGAITYTIIQGPAVVSGNTLTFTGTGGVVIQANQAASVNYKAGTALGIFNVVAGSSSAPALAFNPIPNQTFGAAPFAVSATSNSSGAITYSVSSGPATISGSTVTLTGIGTVTLQASQAASGSYTAASVTTTFTISGTAPTLAFNPIPNQTFGAAPFAVSATSNSPGAITYSVSSGPATISGSTLTLTGAGTVVLTASQAAAGGYNSATTTTSFTVTGSVPTLTFTPIANQTFGAAPFAVSATSNSSGAITYSVTSGPATISGSTVTLTGAGTVILTASQAAAGGYTGTSATTTFSVAGTAPTLTFNAVFNQTFGVAPFAVSATSNSSGAITYSVSSGPATIAGNTVTLTGAGTVVLQASQAASGGYTAASTTTSFTVTGATPTLAFNPIPNQTFGASPFAVSATSNSPGAITYSVTSGPASLAGNILTLTASGTVVLTASQAASGSYTAASVTTTFSISGSAPTLTFTPIANQTFGAAPFAIAATSNSPGAITYTVSSGPASLAGNILTLTASGTVVLTATQAASGSYTAASVTTTFSISGSAPTLAFNPIANQTFGASPFAIAATSNSPGAITYTVTSGPASLSGNILTLTASGTVVLTASQAASGSYTAASVTTTFSISGSAPTLAFNPIANQTFGASPFAIAATSNSPGAITYTVTSGPASLSGNILTLTASGTVVLTASQAASGSYTAASVTTTFSISGSAPTLAFNPIANQTFGASPFAVSATSNSPGAITYTVSSGPASLSGNILTLTASGTVVLTASQAAAGSYTAASVTTTFSISGSAPTLAFNPIANQTFGASPFAVSATSNSPGAITYTVSSGPASLSGNILTLTASGTVVLTATQAASGSYTAASVTTTFSISGSAPTLAFNPIPNQTFGASPFAIAATSNSPGAITYSVTSGPASLSGNILTLTASGTVVLTASQAASGSYTAASVTTTFSISGSAPTLAFNPIPNQTFGASPFAIAATSNSPGAITYSVTSGPASLAGNILTLTASGTVVLTASQAASGSYTAASVTTTFSISGSAPTLAFNPIPNQTFGASPFAIAATSNSPGAITYSVTSGPASLSGNILTLTASGTVVLTASQAASGSYTAASVTTTFSISGSAPTLAFNPIPNQTFGAAPFAIAATSNSPGAITYSVTSGPASLAGNILTLTASGTVVLTASQAASGSYTAASVTTTFSISGSAPTLAFNPIPNQTFGAAPFAIAATSNSPGAITYTVSSGPASLSGNILTLTASGTVVLTASQAASGSYTAASVTTTFSISGSAPTLAFNPIPNQTFGAAPFAIAATSNSPGAITYSVTSGPASLAGNILTLTASGTVVLTASQAASGSYTAASVTTTFSISGSAPTLAFTPIPNQTFGASPFAIAATSNSPGAITYSVSSGPASLAGNIVTLTASGTVVLTATQAASGSYTAASVTTTFSISGSAPTLAFNPIPNQTFGASPFAIAATSNSPGAITYSVSSGPASLAGNIVTLTASGTVVLTATQAASGSYTAASVTTTFSISGSAPTLAFTPIPNQTFGASPFAIAATSNSPGAITYSVSSGPASLAGNIVTLTASGTVVLTATQAASGSYTAASVTTTFSISGSAPTLAFNPIPNQTFGASPFAIAATSNSPGAITYSVSSGPASLSGNILTLTASGTVVLTATQAASGSYTAASVTTTFSISGSAPTLAFTPIPNQTFGAAPFAIAATSNSPGAITYSVSSGPASLSGNILTLTASGTVVLTASQAASGSYTAASVTTTFSISGSAPTLAFNPIPNQTFGAAPFAIAATSNSPGAITYSVSSGPASLAGNILTLTASGTVVLTASQAASGSYTAASVTTTFSISGSAPTLAFNPIANQTFGAAPFAIAATSNSPGAITYSVTSGPASLSGNILTLTASGTVVLTATQAASGSYTAASVTTTFSISGSAPTLAFNPIPNQTFGAAPFAIAATSNSPGAITYSVSSGPASLSGNILTLTASGTVVLTASQAASGSYTAASVTTTFSISGSAPTLAFNPIPNQTFGASPFAIAATSNSPGAITYSVSSGPASLSGNILTLTASGTVVLTASQAASGSYTAASVTTTFSISGSAPTLAFNPIPNQTFGASPFAIAATSNSPGAITYSVTSGPASLSGNILTLTASGTVVLTASQAASGSYTAASVTTTFSISGSAPTLAFNPIPNQTFGAAPFAIAATSNSPGAITYTVTSGPASLSGNILTMNGTGTITVTATQAASGGYAAATVITSFYVVSTTVGLAQDFGFPVTLPPLNVPIGSSASQKIPVVSMNGFAGTINFACALPAAMVEATCDATNIQISASATSSSTITVTTKSGKTVTIGKTDTPNAAKLALLCLLLPLGLPLYKGNRRRLLSVLLAVAFAFGMAGCAGSSIVTPITPAGTYSVLVTAQSAVATHTMNMTVVVQ